MEYRSFEESREFVRGLNICSASKWREYSYGGKRPQDINSHPDRYFKNNGWKGWNDWLGNNNKQYGDRKYTVNDDFFKVWSSDMSYILGFWYTDGYVNREKNIFSITQHKKDKYIMEKILYAMKSNNKLHNHGDNNLNFTIASKKIVDDIFCLGGCKNKTYKIRFPKQIPLEFLPDFIRGLWDGDGCITYQKDSKAYVSNFTGASKKFIVGFLKTLRKEIKNFKGSYKSRIIIKNNGEKSLNYHINVGVNDTRRLGEYMYKKINDNSLFLQRKYEKFKNSGEINMRKVFMSYEKARSLARKNKIISSLEWKNKHKLISDLLPSTPNKTYKNKWTGWENFLNTMSWDFNVSREYVRKLGLKNTKEWLYYTKSAECPINLIHNPYKFKEFISMKDWIGVVKK